MLRRLTSQALDSASDPIQLPVTRRALGAASLRPAEQRGVGVPIRLNKVMHVLLVELAPSRLGILDVHAQLLPDIGRGVALCLQLRNAVAFEQPAPERSGTPDHICDLVPGHVVDLSEEVVQVVEDGPLADVARDPERG
eukprot:CAMPEP_0176220822 /NCGR_PEP_ID=MMETSP0121_2-20121125/19414_1 /TAXON_ID=160619 /ORGANISM="Kryptoperidinium foliaceum, Strain CCMP 1326" /LENGTH=138 /DNA_ID=CAMNT_0017560011 /DNA_START=204 /DNA_END=617 /DNA_ORIENTATION=+